MIHPMDGAMTEAYGQRLGERLRTENAPAIVTRSLRRADLAITEIQCDRPIPAVSDLIKQEDAYLIGLLLRDFPRKKCWEDGRQAPVYDLRAGETSIYDLTRNPTVLLDKPHHSLVFYLPRAALDAIADEANAPRIRDLSYKPGAGVNDVIIAKLGSLLLPALRRPEQANQLFVDYVLLALGAHIAQTYGGMRTARPVRGGLAPWQERRAKDTLRASLKGGVPLKELARECGLSVTYFSHAFRRTLGVAPHNWLIEERIVLSKEKLRDSRLSLADVATECGFSDQSHFTRHFTRAVGVSPGAWRRALRD
jgi:AraC family transcriptional regulator